MQSLRTTGQLDNTVILFSSDHGDYLGDHNLIARLPGGPQNQTSDDLVALADVTPTMLAIAGAEIPAYMDFFPLPGLGLERNGRDYLYGMMGGGWVCFDGRWKLCKYSTGAQMLFDLEQDPTEERNLLK